MVNYGTPIVQTYLNLDSNGYYGPRNQSIVIFVSDNLADRTVVNVGAISTDYWTVNANAFLRFNTGTQIIEKSIFENRILEMSTMPGGAASIGFYNSFTSLYAGINTVTVTANHIPNFKSTNPVSSAASITVDVPELMAISAPSARFSEGSGQVFNIKTNLYPGKNFVYNFSGIDPARVVGGVLSGTVAVDQEGMAYIPFYVLDNIRNDGNTQVTLSVGQIPSANSSYRFTVTDIPPPTTFSLVAENISVNEGSSIAFSLQTTGVPVATGLSYSISGIAAERINGGTLFGTTTVDSNGQARIFLDVKANNRTDGPSTATITIGDNLATASVLINDTSLTPAANPTYSFIVIPDLISEGSSNSLLLQTKNVLAGTFLNYSISGITADRLTNNSLTGTATIDSNGQARIFLDVKANNRTDGPSTATITIGNNLATASVQINDISLTPVTNPFLSFLVSGMNEGEIQTLLINTTGLQSGTILNYNISGIGADRLNSGPLFGTATIDGNGQARITLDVKSNNRTDGQTTVGVSVSHGNYSTTNSFVVNDTSLTPFGNPTYTIIENILYLNEGQSSSMRIQTTNVAAGTEIPYFISGIGADRLTNGLLSGATTVDVNGEARIVLDVRANNRTDGPSTATVTIGSSLASTSVTILDTSLTPGTTQVSLVPKTTYVVNTPNLSISGTNDIDVTAILKTKATFNIDISGTQVSVIDTLGTLGTTVLNNVERLKFSDTNIALDISPSQNAGSVYMLYKAAFNRAPDEGGMGYWLAQKDSGSNIVTNIAAGFVNSPEFIAKYGLNPTNSSYVDKLYLNVLGRPGEAGGVAYWNQELNSGARSKAEVLVQFATLPEGAALVANLIANGITYQEWVG